MISATSLRAPSAFSIISIGTASILAAILVAAPNDAVAESTQRTLCRATGLSCSLGIEPDMYQMPLNGEYIQSGDRQICATKSDPAAPPPEAFDIDFMRAYFDAMNTADQKSLEPLSHSVLTKHWGPPDKDPPDLSAVKTPADFPDEVFRSLQSRATRIEFEVPKSDFEKLGWKPAHASSIPPDKEPNTPLRLRGWYIRGDGLSKEESGNDTRKAERRPLEIKHPLIIMSSGFPYSIAYTNLVGGINVGRQMRKTVTYLVASGYDVLFFDKRGHGYSQGLLNGMGEDIFRALDQLDSGETIEDGVTLSLKIITADGRTIQGRAAVAERLLGTGYTAKSKPVVLRGFSYGSSQLQKAMAMNYSALPVEYRFKRGLLGNIVVDTERRPTGPRGYNFRGIVAISGFPGSVKYETKNYFIALDAIASAYGHGGPTLKSTVYQSMDKWPAFLGLYATNDFETPDGAIDAYNNKLRGIKSIKMVTGYHFGLASEEVDTYFARETERFSRQAVFEIGLTGNLNTTTYAEQVCAAEQVVMDPITQSISGVPSEVIRDANREVDRVIDNWMTIYGNPRVADAAIDPMALILEGKALDIWYEIHQPHEPRIPEIQQVLRSMTPEEQKAVLSRARTLGNYAKAVGEKKRAKTLANYAKAVEEAFATMKK